MVEGRYEVETFVNITDKEDNDELMELPAEKDGTVLLSTVKAQFPSAIGLKYKSSSGGWRGIRAVDNVLDPPSSGWGETTYIITQSDALKRKSSEEGESNGDRRPSQKSVNHSQEIVVFGLPYTTTAEQLKEHFTNSCGELTYHEIKYDRATKKSRGFAFIKFKTAEATKLALEGYHEMDGRKLETRLSRKKEASIKLFVGRLRSGTTREDVLDYFSEFGELTDVFVPMPFRGFGFITYDSEKDGQSVVRMHHVLNGANLNVTVANPLDENHGRGRDSHAASNNRFPTSNDRTNDRGNERSRDRGNDRTNDRGNERRGNEKSRDRGNDRSRDRSRDGGRDMGRDRSRDGSRNGGRNEGRNRSRDRSSDRGSNRNNQGKPANEQTYRYDPRSSGDSHEKKDMASDLKDMLMSLLNEQ